MKLIAATKLQAGDKFNVRSDDPAVRPGNAVSIFSPEGGRVALGRVQERLDTGVRYECQKYVDPRRVVPMNGKTNTAKNVFSVLVEFIFGS